MIKHYYAHQGGGVIDNFGPDRPKLRISPLQYKILKSLDFRVKIEEHETEQGTIMGTFEFILRLLHIK